MTKLFILLFVAMAIPSKLDRRPDRVLVGKACLAGEIRVLAYYTDGAWHAPDSTITAPRPMQCCTPVRVRVVTK